MTILGINCATEKLSIAISPHPLTPSPHSREGEHIIEKHWEGPTIKTENLLLYIDEIVLEAGLKGTCHGKRLSNITKIGIAIGPGAFTGLRLSLITAKTICLENEIPLVPISTLYALAWQNPDSDKRAPTAVRVILNACRGEVSTALFDKDLNRLEEDHPIIRSEIKDDKDTYVVENVLPDAKSIAQIADLSRPNPSTSSGQRGHPLPNGEGKCLTKKEDIIKLVPAYSHEARVNKSSKKELQNLKIGLK